MRPARAPARRSWAYSYTAITPSVFDLGTRGEFTYFVKLKARVTVAADSAAVMTERVLAPPRFATLRDAKRWRRDVRPRLPPPIYAASVSRTGKGKWSFAPFDVRPLTLQAVERLPDTTCGLRTALNEYFGQPNDAIGRLQVFGTMPSY